MRHRRGIDLTAPFRPSHYNLYRGTSLETLASVKEWEVIGAQCGKCERISWLDKRLIEREFGNQYLMHLPRKLKCACGNKEGNTLLIGTLPR